MEGSNLPPEMSAAGYYYSDGPGRCHLGLPGKEMLVNLPQLPTGIGGVNTVRIRRHGEKGWTVTLLADTPVFPGVTSEMMAWWVESRDGR